MNDDLEKAESAPVIRLVNEILVHAVENDASDIHIEPSAESVRLRYRIDGVLREAGPMIEKKMQQAVTSRIKIMCDLNISEMRLPQDGRVHIKTRGKEVDFRISVCPYVHGECIVIRALDRAKLCPDLASLGLGEEIEGKLREWIGRPSGIVLMSGPTGSGKTMTTYCLLQELNRPEVKMVTVEDPVEFLIEGVNQLQINESIGLTRAAALRSQMRQDPDISYIDHLRDQETANIAFQAALTGHLVFSGVYSRNGAAAVRRLLDMGIDPVVLGGGLIGVCSQRLIRRICQDCKEEYEVSEELASWTGVPKGSKLFKGKGCSKCTRGYKGRSAVLELFEMTPDIATAILAGADEDTLQKLSADAGSVSLRAAAIAKAQEGITTIEDAAMLDA